LFQFKYNSQKEVNLFEKCLLLKVNFFSE